jgi:thiamine biosynthesis lipoprotein ApbE
MKQFVEKNFTIIVLVIALLTFFKGCSDSRELSKMKNEIKQIKDSTYTKTELNIVLQIEGLKSEKRMIQATDRKMLDVQRQTEIDNEVSKLQEEVIKW